MPAFSKSSVYFLSECLPKLSPSNTFPCKKNITLHIERYAEGGWGKEGEGSI